MRNYLLLVACVAISACTPDDTAHIPIFLTAPYNTWPPAPATTPIEPGRPVGLNGRQQASIVTGVMKWMKDPVSVQFRGIEGVQNSRGLVTVCGEVSGRNTAGRQIGMEPFVGVLMGPDEDADFVLVGIGSSERERTEVSQLCRASGIFSTD
ncbi:MAG: hypothetical protein ACXWLB_01755 [Reyranella sp.]